MYLSSTEIGHEKAQSVIDSITSSYADAGQANPMLQPPAGVGGFPPPFPGGLPGTSNLSGSPITLSKYCQACLLLRLVCQAALLLQAAVACHFHLSHQTVPHLQTFRTVCLSLHPVAFLQISRYHPLVRPVVFHLQDNQVDQVRVQGLKWDRGLRQDSVDRLVREETEDERYR
jgi:hypothetical protein